MVRSVLKARLRGGGARGERSKSAGASAQLGDSPCKQCMLARYQGCRSSAVCEAFAARMKHDVRHDTFKPATMKGILKHRTSCVILSVHCNYIAIASHFSYGCCLGDLFEGFTVSQLDITVFLWIPETHRAHTTPPLDCILCQINSVQLTPPHFIRLRSIYPEDRHDMFITNSGNHLHDNTASQPRRPKSIVLILSFHLHLRLPSNLLP
jgi:hypothetical protein